MGDTNLSNLEIARIIIYTKIQAIRLDNICEYINEPDALFNGYNHFLFGVRSTNKKDEVIQLTKAFVSIFLLEELKKIESLGILTAISPVIWKSEKNIFCVTDNAVFKEVDIDGRFLFLFMPISPKYAVVLSKNSYFSFVANLQRILNKTGDQTLAMSINDRYLINGFSHKSIIHLSFSKGKPKEIPIYKIEEKNVIRINSAVMNDAKKIIFYDGNDQEILDYIARKDSARKITLSQIKLQ